MLRISLTKQIIFKLQWHIQQQQKKANPSERNKPLHSINQSNICLHDKR